MTEIDRRSALMGLLRGAAVVGAGLAVMPGSTAAMELASGGAAEVLNARDFYARAQVVVVGPRPAAVAGFAGGAGDVAFAAGAERPRTWRSHAEQGKAIR
jgi:hypothetical protein